MPCPSGSSMWLHNVTVQSCPHPLCTTTSPPSSGINEPVVFNGLDKSGRDPLLFSWRSLNQFEQFYAFYLGCLSGIRVSGPSVKVSKQPTVLRRRTSLLSGASAQSWVPKERQAVLPCCSSRARPRTAEHGSQDRHRRVYMMVSRVRLHLRCRSAAGIDRLTVQ